MGFAEVVFESFAKAPRLFVCEIVNEVNFKVRLISVRQIWNRDLKFHISIADVLYLVEIVRLAISR